MQESPYDGVPKQAPVLPKEKRRTSSMNATSTEFLSTVNRTSVIAVANHQAMDVNARIRASRIAAGFRSAQEAARRFGWTPSTYASHENGQTRTPSIEVIETYAAAFKVSPEYLAFGSRSNGEANIPVLGFVGAGDHVNIILEDGNAIDWIIGPPMRLFSVIVRGDSMEPVYREGDVIFFKPPTSRSAAIGHDCVLVTETNKAYIKHLKRGESAGRYDLYSYNAVDPIRDVLVRWAAPITWVRRSKA